MINLKELVEKRKEKAKSPKKCKGTVKFCCIGCVSFGFFQIGHLPFTRITFLDTCQKTVSIHAPQFRSNRSVAPKLLLIITANVQIYLNLPIRRYIESPFCPRAKVINISIFFSAGTSPIAPLLPSLFKNTLALPPPL